MKAELLSKMALTWPVVLVLYAGCISVAYLCLKLYDIPVRKWLKRMIGQSVS